MALLRDFLEQRFAARGGALPFDEFMEAALYDPTHGYYSARLAELGGPRGDFATAATLSEGLGRALAAWVKEQLARFPDRRPVALIEIGGGNGLLAAAILRSLGWRHRRRVRYHLVERSPLLRERQGQRLGRSITAWHDTPASALAACGGRALILSNELIDAFPAKWLCYEGGRWHEIWVRWGDGGLREEFRELPPELSADTYTALALPHPPEGQRIEILPSCRQWLGTWLPLWREGAMLTIDYGAANASALYDRRPAGTLRGYWRHQRVEGAALYARFGQQDLTSDVNFADLMLWGREWGKETLSLKSQREFLQRHGCGDDPMAAPGPGDAFLVLEQGA